MATLHATAAGLQVGARWLVREVTLRIGPGEVVALVGPNGAGKSTLMRLLGGDIPATEGSVSLDDRDISSYRPKALALLRAVLPQQTLIQFSFTAGEVVEMGLSARDGDPVGIGRALARADALDLQHRIYPSLSGGEQARVSLARVLAQETPVILLDEPTAALDLRHQQLVMRLAREIAAEGGTVVAILHDLNLAAAFADRIAILHDGRLVADGSPWDVLTGPLLTEVFGCPIAVTPHPLSGCPLVLVRDETGGMMDPTRTGVAGESMTTGVLP